eukprot:scaffold2544_cov269-Chaetoceros_neogracile.AAC.33
MRYEFVQLAAAVVVPLDTASRYDPNGPLPDGIRPPDGLFGGGAGCDGERSSRYPMESMVPTARLFVLEDIVKASPWLNIDNRHEAFIAFDEIFMEFRSLLNYIGTGLMTIVFQFVLCFVFKQHINH